MLTSAWITVMVVDIYRAAKTLWSRIVYQTQFDSAYFNVVDVVESLAKYCRYS